MSQFFKVKDFDRFQHYKDRSPPWIKLYNALLDDYAFGCLQDASKMHLVAIWLLASRSDNKVPRDPEWIAKRINATDPVDLDALEAAGFIITIQDDKQMVQDASAPLAKRLTRERDTNEETERDLEVGAQVPKAISSMKDRRVEVSPSDPVLQRPDDPLAAYSDTELKAFAFEFDGLDVESAICELSAWCDRKGVTDLIERRNMIYGGLKKRHGRAALHDAMQTPTTATASPELLKSLKKSGWDKLEIPKGLDRRRASAA